MFTCAPSLMVATSGGGGGAGTVSMIDYSTLVYTIAGSQNATVPATAAADDLLLSVLMHRDTITPPAGWVLVDSISYTESSTLQYLSIYEKVAVSGDVGFSTTWTQASSARMAVQIQAIRGTDGTPTALLTSKASRPTGGGNPPIPELTGTADGQLLVTAFGRVLSSSSNTISSGYTMTSPASDPDNRMIIAHRSMSLGFTNSGNFVPDNDAGYSAISVLLG